MLGVDEAGRGPVLGPMIYGVAYWPIEQNEKISALGFDDSKALSAEQRESMFETIKGSDLVGWKVRVIHANEISRQMFSQTNLNEISRNAAIELIEAVQASGVEVVEVYVDTVGDPKVYENFLTRKFNNTIRFTVAKKADSLYKVVGAASICAKVTRDTIIHSWKWNEKNLDVSTSFGSGYPSDPKTKEWLKQNTNYVFGYPNIVRFSWGTVDSYLKSMAPVNFADEDQTVKSIKRHFTATMTKSQPKRLKYFNNFHMEHCSSF